MGSSTRRRILPLLMPSVSPITSYATPLLVACQFQMSASAAGAYGSVVEKENTSSLGLAFSAFVGALLAVYPLYGVCTITILYVAARLHLNKAMAVMAIPTIFSQLITLIYNMADTWFIGRTNNPYMVAASSLVLTVFLINLISLRWT